MTGLEAAIRQIDSGLRHAGARFALVGGLAVSVRTEPRFTRDADLAVAVGDDAEAEALIRALPGYTIAAVVEQEAVGRMATVRLTPLAAPDGPVIDLLFASSGIEAEIVSTAEILEALPGLDLPIARVEHLIALKVLSRDDVRRPQDLVDLRALLRRASADDLAGARRSLSLIIERGYQRGRSLLAEFDALLRV